MVVFDQHTVKEPEAVVRSLAGLYSVFVEESEAGGGLSGIGYPGLEPFYGLHIFIGKCGDTGKSLENIKRCPFGGQKAAGAALDRCQNRSSFYRSTVFF
ncbi:hypothetical protein BMS3Abin09_00475 [bacterium BMS3Abin09]|nr:hypothetical protein BMS3Abin09_00475 [bacterium BMS3Abin09]